MEAPRGQLFAAICREDGGNFTEACEMRCFTANRMIERVGQEAGPRRERRPRERIEVDNIPGYPFDLAEDADTGEAESEPSADLL